MAENKITVYEVICTDAKASFTGKFSFGYFIDEEDAKRELSWRQSQYPDNNIIIVPEECSQGRFEYLKEYIRDFKEE